MGVNWFPCDRCSASICDAGDWVRCNGDCGRRWCCDECASQDGLHVAENEYGDRDDPTCNFCRGQDLEDAEVMAWCLKKLKMTRQDAVKACVKARKRKQNKKGGKA